MHKLLDHVTIRLHDALFQKDPSTSDVGREIIHKGAALVAREGLESFTFRKLASEMGSTESTIYRYFRNKQQLLQYLMSMYWSTLEWKIAFATANVENGVSGVDKLIEVLSDPLKNEVKTHSAHLFHLHNIAIRESAKTYDPELTKKIQVGYISAYSDLIERISKIITTAQPRYKYSRSIAVALVETAHHLSYFHSIHPDVVEPPTQGALKQILHHIAFTAIKS
jgi:AcrR family transcriptional regulator